MLIECLLKREGPIVVPIGNEVYRFEPDHEGRRVAEVWLDSHVEMFLSSGASALYRRLDEPPPRRDDPRYTGPDPAPPSPPAPPPPTASPAPSPSPAPAPSPTLETEPEPPLSAEGAQMPGIGGYAAHPAPTTEPMPPPTTTPTPPAANGKAAQPKFDRKALIAKAKELGIERPHSQPSLTLDSLIRARTS